MPKITPHSKTLLSQLNRGRLPEQLEFFTRSSNHKSSNKLKAYVEEWVGGRLNESNTRFLEYLTSHYIKNVFVKNYMKNTCGDGQHLPRKRK